MAAAPDYSVKLSALNQLIERLSPEEKAAFCANDDAKKAIDTLLQLAGTKDKGLKMADNAPPANPAAKTNPQNSAAALRPGAVPASGSNPLKVPSPGASNVSFRMARNGKVGEEYNASIEPEGNVESIKILAAKFPDEIGLAFDAKNTVIRGTPSRAGDHVVTIEYVMGSSAVGQAQKFKGTVQVIINPDPKNLWKNIDSNTDAKYWKKDNDADFKVGDDGLALIAASKRGRSHAQSADTFRDDDFRIDHDPATGWRIMAVADGAGSAEMSRQGSKLAVEAAIEAARQCLAGAAGKQLSELSGDLSTEQASQKIKDALRELFSVVATQAVNSIAAEAKTAGLDYKKFSTTLIVTIHKKIEAGHFVAAYWVGDGGAGIFSEGKGVKTLGKADSGEFAGQTRFLDQAMLKPDELRKRIKCRVVQDFTAIMAMTDGLTDPKFETDANFEKDEKWAELWSELQSKIESDKPKENLLEWLDFWSPGNHDDRTIAILYPRKSETTDQSPAKDKTHE